MNLQLLPYQPEADPALRAEIARFTEEQWFADFVVACDEVLYPADMRGFYARDAEGRLAGLITYYLRDDGSCEITTLNSLIEGQGLGTALIEAVVRAAREAGCRRVWLITTNDNIEALRFYQRRGFELVAVHRGAVNRTRERYKPNIPVIGNHGIPLRDEIELEMVLADSTPASL